MNTLNVQVRCCNVSRRISSRTIRRRAERLLVHLGLHDAKLSVLLCDDGLIHQLNKDFRSVDKPTDVLSFSMQEGERLEGDSTLLGDIVISIDTAERQAPSLDHNLTSEVTSLLIHGLLHLLGYDHVEDSDEQLMQKKAQQLESLFS